MSRSLASRQHSQFVVAAIFSIDFDQSCLLLDLTDANDDGTPDAITFAAPAAFNSGATVNLTDTNGEIDLNVIDTALPFSPLSTGVLAAVGFTASTAPTCANQPLFVGFSRRTPLLLSGIPAAMRWLGLLLMVRC